VTAVDPAKKFAALMKRLRTDAADAAPPAPPASETEGTPARPDLANNSALASNSSHDGHTGHAGHAGQGHAGHAGHAAHTAVGAASGEKLKATPKDPAREGSAGKDPRRDARPGSRMLQPPPEDSVLRHLVFAMLMWEATGAAAAPAYRKLKQAFVDFNELRVALPHEVAQVIGESYPKAEERAARLKSMLLDVHRREHSLSLAKMLDVGKREARLYLESLDGAPAYAAARVFLVALGGHAIPIDERLRVLLVREKSAEDGLTPEQTASWAERQIKAGDALAAHVALQVWADAQPMFETMNPPPPTAKPGASRATGAARPAKTKTRKGASASGSAGPTGTGGTPSKGARGGAGT
jgi:endonuclease III